MTKALAITAVLGFCLSPSLAPAKEEKKNEPRVEIKCLVPENKIAEISAKLDLASKTPIVRVVCFFDTDSLDLFHHVPTQLILRSRSDSSETDTTVKVRGAKMEKNEDVECESDKVCGKEPTESCSITNDKEQRAEIKTANCGKDIKKIFSQKQRALAEKDMGKLAWHKLQPFGPVQGVQVWKKIEVAAIPGVREAGPPLTVERWDLPARQGKPPRILFEVSAKVSIADEPKISKWLADFLALPDSGSEESETKTKIVLEHFAEKSP
jgi:hypothetical protein